MAIETEFQDFAIPEHSWETMQAKDYTFKNFIFDLNSKFSSEEHFSKELLATLETQINTNDWKTSYDILTNILSTEIFFQLGTAQALEKLQKYTQTLTINVMKC